MNEHELKPCPMPHCKSTMVKLHENSRGPGDCAIECEDCGFSMVDVYKQGDCVTYYNNIPRNDLSHALAALEAFDSIGPRMYQSPDKTWNVVICTSRHYKDRYWANNKSLSAAITEALCKATGCKI